MKNKINIACFLVITFGFLIAFVIKGDDELSRDERRYLATKDSLDNYLDGEFSGKFESYLLDQFPMRSEFRNLKAFATFKLFGKIENQDIVIYDGYAIKIQPDYKYEDVSVTMDKINELIATKFKRNRCFFALIPDKSVFYDDFDGSMSCDYEKVERLIKEKLTRNTAYIEIKNTLNLEDYYRTDSHWSQDKLLETRNEILKGMSMPIPEESYTTNSIDSFVGVYKSQSALDIKPDTIKYLTNEALDNVTVFDYETGSTHPIYTLDKLEDPKSMDKYDVFLSGSAALLRIDNPSALSDRTLYVFRDSYGSSLTPLLAESYKTIYLVDLRYIDSSLLDDYVTVTPNDDVLFIYSTLLINTPNNYKITER